MEQNILFDEISRDDNLNLEEKGLLFTLLTTDINSGCFKESFEEVKKILTYLQQKHYVEIDEETMSGALLLTTKYDKENVIVIFKSVE